MSVVCNLGGWICFIIAVINFLGIGSSAGDAPMALLGELIPTPDVKTLLWSGAGVLLGYLALHFREANAPKRGIKVIICSIVCAVLTFTPLSHISTFSALLAYQEEQRTSDGLEPVPEEEYSLYAYLGSGNSNPSDVDIMEYIIDGYDGHARDTYKTYKITGWIYREGGPEWYDLEMSFRLIDEEGKDILADGQPVILRYEEKDKKLDRPEGAGSFQTNTVRAKDLSGTPYGFRVESVERGYFIDMNDGSKHDSPIYN